MSIFKQFLSPSSSNKSPGGIKVPTSSRRRSEFVPSYKDADERSNDFSIVIQNYDELLSEANKSRRHSVPDQVLSTGVASFLDTIQEVKTTNYFILRRRLSFYHERSVIFFALMLFISLIA